MAASLHDVRYRRLIDLVVTARKQAGLTQREVASRLRLHQSYIGKIESRQRRIDLVELVDLLEAIGVKAGPFVAAAIADMRRR